MAVPFSRPRYSNREEINNNNDRRHRRRPNRGRSNNNDIFFQSPAGHRINGADLSQLSFTSRLAFYALYETWRLLMTISGEELPNNMGHHIEDFTADPPTDYSEADTSAAEEQQIAFPDVVSATEGHRSNSEVSQESSTLVIPDLISCHETASLFEKEEVSEGKEAEERKSLYCEWHRVGFQLCEIASAFEVHFAPSNPSHLKLFHAYRRMKLSLLRRDKKRCRGSGGGGSICRQIVLSGVWMLLKQIL